MKDNEQILRIKGYEEKMECMLELVRRYEEDLASYEEFRKLQQELQEYYETSWKKDFEDDEAGKFPAGLKRGILSEDGLYDLLERADVLQKEIMALLSERKRIE